MFKFGKIISIMAVFVLFVSGCAYKDDTLSDGARIFMQKTPSSSSGCAKYYAGKDKLMVISWVDKLRIGCR